MSRRVMLLLVAIVTVGLAGPVGSVGAAPVGPVLVTNGNFAAPDLQAWEPTGGAAIDRNADAAFQASHSLEVTASGLPGSGVRTVARHQTAPGQHVLTMAVKGTASSVGQVVRASITDPATGETKVSAPVHLQPWWQTVGVSATTTGSPLEFAVHEQATGGLAPAGAWSAGDTWLVDAVSARAQGPTVVTTEGRQLLVDGEPVAIRSYWYLSAPVGGAGFAPPGWNFNAAQCESDANLLRAAGVNMLRILYQEQSYEESSYRQCLDAFQAAGLGLMWLVQPPSGAQLHVRDPAWIEAYWQHLKLAVERLEHHPATFGYSIGDEIRHQQPESDGWFVTLEELARRTKELDPNHVTTTTINSPQFFGFAGPGGNGVGPGEVPSIDLWGLNRRAGVRGFSAGLWQDIVDQDRTRPVEMSSFGTDRYRCIQDFGTIFNPLFLATCGAGSGIDQAPQAEWNALQWSQIAANLSVDNPDGAVVGGTVFMWSDIWWFSFPFFTGGVTTPATHEVSGVSCINPINGNRNNTACTKFPDQHFEPEWIGSTLALPVQAPGPRATSLAYDRIGSLFRGAPGPTVTSLQVDSVGACEATLSWTTDVPTFARVDFGPTVDVVREDVRDNLIMADNFVTTDHVQGTTATTTHTVTLPGLLPGTEHRAHVRGFDADGMSGTRPPIEFTTATADSGPGCLQ